MAAPREKARQNKGDKMAASTQMQREKKNFIFGVGLNPSWGNSARNFSNVGSD
jgi:hypothetical protein